MAKTSIHFEACNTSKSELHNSRKQELDYIFKELSHNNESAYYDSRPLKEIENNIRSFYKEKVGRKMPSNTVPIREAVVVIDEKTSMQDISILSKEIEKLLGWKPLSFHIHRDEGYVKSALNKTDEKVLNLHAHITFNCQDQNTGKMVKIDKIKLSKLQTVTADVLGMERGKSSTRKHLKSLEFKIEKKQEEITKLQEQFENAISSNTSLIKSNIELESEIKKLREEQKRLNSKIDLSNKNLDKLESIENDSIDILEDTLHQMEQTRKKGRLL